MANPSQRTPVGKLKVATVLHDFINNEVLPGLGVDAQKFWSGFEAILNETSKKNETLLKQRDQHQAAIDAWHVEHRGQAHDHVAYKEHLIEIGYITPEVEPFKVSTQNVDAEIATISGPQLVVPVTNARFATNAANARWGKLYDMYGTDALDGTKPPDSYDPIRGAKVIAYGRKLLDDTTPLLSGSHADAVSYVIKNGTLVVTLENGTTTGLKQPEQFKGYRGIEEKPSAVLLEKHGLHAEIQINRKDRIGKSDKAGISEILLESAVTTIMDLEDSVATVSQEEKVEGYRKWLGLMKGDINGDFVNAKGELVERRLNPDRLYHAPDGQPLMLRGRSLMLVRNVGMHMYSDSIIDQHDNQVPEGVMDGVVTALIAMHDLKQTGPLRNSREGSVYIVKPKMHGPEDVAFTCKLFSRIEDLLDLPRNTLKIGIMDEERRMSLNLQQALWAAHDRVCFINTGFLDRTGDEYHTSMLAGPLEEKASMNGAHWKLSYEDNNVDKGIGSGLKGRAQIGKGMWPRPDDMHAMMAEKGGHPRSGASTAWVPSPTAAVLHGLHYRYIDVAAAQKSLLERNSARTTTDDLLQIPLADLSKLTPQRIQNVVDNNCQSILGYVVRWIDQGVGCSKVPDINNVSLMEDRATLRISSQNLANWLLHGICTKEQVEESLERMTGVVNQQNRNVEGYQAMTAPLSNNVAFQAASDLIFKGIEQPNGYTEFTLNRYRTQKLGQLNVG